VPATSGVSGDGGKSPEGLTCTRNLPDPARAIRDGQHILEHFEQSRLQIRAAVFPRPSLFGALLGGAKSGRGRECWEDLKKLLFVLRSSASPGDRALVPCGLWARFFQLNRSALAPTPK
jgi:hypothetical protein